MVRTQTHFCIAWLNLNPPPPPKKMLWYIFRRYSKCQSLPTQLTYTPCVTTFYSKSVKNRIESSILNFIFKKCINIISEVIRNPMNGTRNGTGSQWQHPVKKIIKLKVEPPGDIIMFSITQPIATIVSLAVHIIWSVYIFAIYFYFFPWKNAIFVPQYPTVVRGVFLVIVK